MLKKGLAMFILVCILLTFSSFTIASDTTCDSVDEAIVSISDGITSYEAKDSEMISVASAQKDGSCDKEFSGMAFCPDCGVWTKYHIVICENHVHNQYATCKSCGRALF